MPEARTAIESSDLVFADRQVVGKWLRLEAVLAIAKQQPVVISPELAMHLADLLLQPFRNA